MIQGFGDPVRPRDRFHEGIEHVRPPEPFPAIPSPVSIPIGPIDNAIPGEIHEITLAPASMFAPHTLMMRSRGTLFLSVEVGGYTMLASRAGFSLMCDQLVPIDWGPLGPDKPLRLRIANIAVERIWFWEGRRRLKEATGRLFARKADYDVWLETVGQQDTVVS